MLTFETETENITNTKQYQLDYKLDIKSDNIKQKTPFEKKQQKVKIP